MAYRFGRRRDRSRKRVYGSLLLLITFTLGLVTGTIGVGYTNASAEYVRSGLVKMGVLKTKGGWTMTAESHAILTSAQNSRNAVSSTDTKATTPRSENCGAAPAMHSGLANAQSPQLQKLAEYEQACDAAIAGRSMLFVPTPKSIAEAQASASDVASTLHDYARYGIAPLVVLEPSTSSGPVNFIDYRNGSYDQALDTYFATIKASGITDAQMGMWVVFPEANIPEWGSTDPGDFAANVTKTIQFQKKYFPASLASIMLDSESYTPGASWGNGNYASLLPYVQSIPHGLVDSFGLQGFPWMPAANDLGAASTDPATYLSANIAAEAAHSLDVRNVWLNTGTFGRAYTNNAQQTISISPKARQAMLDGVLTQTKALQRQGFSVAVHLFAEDKSATSEAIDWSYWPKGQAASSTATAVFKTFTHDLQVANIPLWLFDTDSQ